MSCCGACGGQDKKNIQDKKQETEKKSPFPKKERDQGNEIVKT